MRIVKDENKEDEMIYTLDQGWIRKKDFKEHEHIILPGEKQEECLSEKREHTTPTNRFNVGKDTYQQPNWSAYNQAQTIEKNFVLKVLDELLCHLHEETPKRRGRPEILLRDQIFAICLHQYLGLSSRRSNCDMLQAVKQHYIFSKFHFTTLMRFYDNEKLTSILKKLIEATAIPLSQVESGFAIDATGFSTTYFGRWFDAKFGKLGNVRQFKKCHLTSGVSTNIITAVNITYGTSADCNELPDLIQRTAINFDIKEVFADKAYSSRKNLEAVAAIGAVPYIPFRCNTTGKSNGMIWKFMFNYYREHSEEFKARYHLRSNVESTFSSIKRRLNERLTTKGEVSQTNEILVKCLVFNMIVLCHEFHELNINIEFDKVISATDRILVQNG